jgi:hypothetical protein
MFKKLTTGVRDGYVNFPPILRYTAYWLCNSCSVYAWLWNRTDSTCLEAMLFFFPNRGPRSPLLFQDIDEYPQHLRYFVSWNIPAACYNCLVLL